MIELSTYTFGFIMTMVGFCAGVLVSFIGYKISTAQMFEDK